MTSDTKRYVELQNVYRRKAAKDSAIVYQHLQNIQARILLQVCSEICISCNTTHEPVRLVNIGIVYVCVYIYAEHIYAVK